MVFHGDWLKPGKNNLKIKFNPNFLQYMDYFFCCAFCEKVVVVVFDLSDANTMQHANVGVVKTTETLEAERK